MSNFALNFIFSAHLSSPGSSQWWALAVVLIWMHYTFCMLHQSRVVVMILQTIW
jgi:hypothetical protein